MNNHNMFLQNHFLAESLVADAASKRFFSGVNEEVLLEVPFEGEGAATNRTRKHGKRRLSHVNRREICVCRGDISRCRVVEGYA